MKIKETMDNFLDDYLADNPACKSTNVTFGIIGFDFDPHKFTRDIRIKPTKSYVKGESLETKVGDKHQRPYSLWSFTTENHIESTSPEKHAQYLLELIEEKRDLLLKYINDSAFRTAISIWWESKDGHGGFTLSSETISRFSKLCQEIDFFFL